MYHSRGLTVLNPVLRTEDPLYPNPDTFPGSVLGSSGTGSGNGREPQGRDGQGPEEWLFIPPGKQRPKETGGSTHTSAPVSRLGWTRNPFFILFRRHYWGD